MSVMVHMHKVNICRTIYIQ